MLGGVSGEIGGEGEGGLQLKGAAGADGVDGCLVVGEDEVGVHVMGLWLVSKLPLHKEEMVWVGTTNLVHKAKDNLLVVHESASKLAPEFTELLGGCRHRVRGIANDAAGHGLLRWVVVSHVVVGVQDAVGALGDGDVVHGVLNLGEVL